MRHDGGADLLFLPGPRRFIWGGIKGTSTMGRPRGSRNKPKDNGESGANGDDGELRNTISGEQLRGYIERIEYCNEQQAEISTDRQQVFKELKQAGYDRDTVREIV